jgi:hypothetical protein
VRQQYLDLSLQICGKLPEKALGLPGVAIIRTLTIQHGRTVDLIISSCRGRVLDLSATHHEFGLQVLMQLAAYSQAITPLSLLTFA